MSINDKNIVVAETIPEESYVTRDGSTLKQCYKDEADRHNQTMKAIEKGMHDHISCKHADITACRRFEHEQHATIMDSITRSYQTPLDKQLITQRNKEWIHIQQLTQPTFTAMASWHPDKIHWGKPPPEKKPVKQTSKKKTSTKRVTFELN
jgi:hypothetical protein